MWTENITKLTFKEFLSKKGINRPQIKSVSPRTIANIIEGDHGWAKHNKNYRWRLPYFPTESTISKLSLELEITYTQLETLIKNQFKSNKK